MKTLLHLVVFASCLSLVRSFPPNEWKKVVSKLRMKLPLIDTLDDIDDLMQPLADFYSCDAEACEKAFMGCVTQAKWDCRGYYPGLLYKESGCYLDGIKDCKEKRAECEQSNNFGENCE